MIRRPIYQFLGMCLLSRLNFKSCLTAHLVVQGDTFHKFFTPVFAIVG